MAVQQLARQPMVSVTWCNKRKKYSSRYKSHRFNAENEFITNIMHNLNDAFLTATHRWFVVEGALSVRCRSGLCLGWFRLRRDLGLGLRLLGKVQQFTIKLIRLQLQC